MNDVTKRAVIVAAVVLGLFSLVRAVSYFQGDPFDMAHDLIIDHVAGRAILEGEDPYQSVRLMQQEYLPESARHEAGRAAVDLPNWHTPTRLLLHLPLAKLS
ncbi:MAG: hypothetical protein ACRDKS_05000, partial [Actinomycetota bacterium]